MKTLILSNNDLRKLVRRVGVDQLMDDLIDRLAIAFKTFDDQATEIPARTGFYYDVPGTGLIEWMPLFKRHETVLMKIVGYHPQSPALNRLPTILSTLSIYDTTTGHLLALVDGTLLTALRTGAASAVATRWLARPESKTCGLIGCGAQAVTQLHAISRVFQLREVLIYDIEHAVSDTLVERAWPAIPKSLAIRTVPVESILAESDIISVATSVDVGKGPVFHPTETKPWVHINAVGSDLPGKTELPQSLLEKSFICADHPEQAKKEGECQQLSPHFIGAALSEVARQPHAFCHVQQRTSVFDSTGWALEDQVAMDLVLEYAEKLNIGSELEIECIADDPRSPYEFLIGSSGSNGEKRSRARASAPFFG